MGDINGDGKLDLATANHYNASASILLNTTPTGGTTPSFATQGTFPTGSGPRSVSLGDINGDMKLDIAVANEYDNTASILLNTTDTGATTPSFATQYTFSTGTNPSSVSLGDINADGKPDLAVANWASKNVSILVNTTPTGDPVPYFAPQITFPTGDGPRSVSIRDFNADGKPDLAVANSGSNTVSILLNTTPKVTAVTATTPDGSYRAVIPSPSPSPSMPLSTSSALPQLQLETGTTDRFATYTAVAAVLYSPSTM
jgi:hypothetical protein